MEPSVRTLFPDDPCRLAFHLMPPDGWMNDPNGLCYFNGEYHIFFQYSPGCPEGGNKWWGHYAGPDLTHLRYVGTPLSPDRPYDRDGVFSGSAIVSGGRLLLYFTGNVTDPATDRIYTGREGNTCLAESADGYHFTKECLMTNADYPAACTCHVRDPKVWKEGGTFRMVQGTRLDGRPGADRGAILFFRSEDGRKWVNETTLTTEKPFGYMWECPDFFRLDGHPYLACSPQGLPEEAYRWQNESQAGYFTLPQDFEPGQTPLLDRPEECFREWDFGFDFYAPQTFEDAAGRRILFGWAGVSYRGYDNAPTIRRGWQHALTVPRVLHRQPDTGILCQQPAAELESLRHNRRTVSDGQAFALPERTGDIVMEALPDGPVTVSLAAEDCPLFTVSIGPCPEGGKMLELTLGKEAGRGRTRRVAKLPAAQNLRILLDTSLAEIYADDGAVVMTTRFYAPETAEGYTGYLHGAGAEVWDMAAHTVVFAE